MEDWVSELDAVRKRDGPGSALPTQAQLDFVCYQLKGLICVSRLWKPLVVTDWAELSMWFLGVSALT